MLVDITRIVLERISGCVSKCGINYVFFNFLKIILFKLKKKMILDRFDVLISKIIFKK
jgi:hypothetical protein